MTNAGSENTIILFKQCNMQTILDDAEHWWSRAEEARTIAELIDDPEARRIMFDIAEGYERLAERAAERVAARSPASI